MEQVMTQVKKFFQTARYNYWQMIYSYELGSTGFRLKVEVCGILAGTVAIILTFMTGWSFAGSIHGF